MSTDTKTRIVELLRPFIESQGFQLVDAEDDEAITLDFRRVIKPDWHFLSLQFDKHGRDRFVLEAGKCPEQGVTYFGEHYASDKVTTAHLPLRARLQPGRGHSTSNWFRTDSFFGLIRSSPERVFQEVKSLFPEIDRWLKTGQAGEHVQVIDLTGAMQGDGNAKA